MGETELEVAVLEEMEREIDAWDKVEEDTATEYLLEIWADELKEMKEVEKLDTIEKIRDWLGPEQLVGTALIFKRQQVWELKKHYSMDPFPSHSTLVALASRLGVEEHQVQSWDRTQGLGSQCQTSSPPPSWHPAPYWMTQGGLEPTILFQPPKGLVSD
ncbi:uncharacterized protein LOC144371022 isoform X2 [Ictidomys tridecemlineatus]